MKHIYRTEILFKIFQDLLIKFRLVFVCDDETGMLYLEETTRGDPNNFTVSSFHTRFI